MYTQCMCIILSWTLEILGSCGQSWLHSCWPNDSRYPPKAINNQSRRKIYTFPPFRLTDAKQSPIDGIWPNENWQTPRYVTLKHRNVNVVKWPAFKWVIRTGANGPGLSRLIAGGAGMHSVLPYLTDFLWDLMIFACYSKRI